MRDIAEVRTELESGERWVRFSGELEIDSVALLESAVADALDAGEEDVVLDLSATTFVDSTGLSGLLAASRDVALRDRRMRTFAPPGHEARVLIDLSGTGRTLGLFP